HTSFSRDWSSDVCSSDLSPPHTTSTASPSPACCATKTPRTSASRTAVSTGPRTGSCRRRPSPRSGTASPPPTAPARSTTRATTSARSASFDCGSRISDLLFNPQSAIRNPQSEIAMRSFLDVPPDTPFSLHNLPYGVFTRRGYADPRVGVAVGDQVLDLAVLAER